MQVSTQQEWFIIPCSHYIINLDLNFISVIHNDLKSFSSHIIAADFTHILQDYTSLALWKSSDCPSASEATLKNMDKYFTWIPKQQKKTYVFFMGLSKAPFLSLSGTHFTMILCACDWNLEQTHFCSNSNSYNLISSQICTCHDSCVVVACAKFWLDLSIIFPLKARCIFAEIWIMSS